MRRGRKVRLSFELHCEVAEPAHAALQAGIASAHPGFSRALGRRHLDHRSRNSVAGAFHADMRNRRSPWLAIGGFVIGSRPLISKRTAPRTLTFSPGASQK